MAKKIKTLYIPPMIFGKPASSLTQVLDDAAFEAFRSAEHHNAGRPAKGRRKVRITVTVEEVK